MEDKEVLFLGGERGRFGEFVLSWGTAKTFGHDFGQKPQG